MKETVEFLDLSIPTIYNKISRGDLPFMKRAKRIYFLKNDLMKYMKEGRRKTRSEMEEDANEYLKKLEGL